MAYGSEEFEIILNELRKGMKLKEIAEKHYMSEKTIRNLLMSNGYKFDKKQGLWYSKLQKNAIYIMNNCDIEYEIEQLSKQRYYDRYVDPYPNEEPQEQEEVSIHKGLYLELSEVAEEYCCDFTEELIELILLRFLEKTRKKDLKPLFRKKWFLENGYNEKEVKILMKYNDEDNVPTNADELFWEDDCNYEEAKELKNFYKEELQKNNVDISDMKKYMNEHEVNEFGYLKIKYDEMTGNTFLKEREKRIEKECWEREEEYLNDLKEKGIPYDEDDLKLLKELKKYKLSLEE